MPRQCSSCRSANLPDPERSQQARHPTLSTVVNRGNQLFSTSSSKSIQRFHIGDLQSVQIAKVRDQGLLDMFNGIVLIDLESASPLISPAYETGETEESLRAAFKEVYAKL